MGSSILTYTGGWGIRKLSSCGTGAIDNGMSGYVRARLLLPFLCFVT